MDPATVQALAGTENARFIADRPRSAELTEQAHRSMPRGVPMAWMADLYDHLARLDRPRRGRDACYFFVPEPPIDGPGARAADNPALRNLIRVFMANRGVWESGWWLGPTVSVAHTADDVDRYLEVFEEFLSAVA